MYPDLYTTMIGDAVPVPAAVSLSKLQEIDASYRRRGASIGFNLGMGQSPRNAAPFQREHDLPGALSYGLKTICDNISAIQENQMHMLKHSVGPAHEGGNLRCLANLAHGPGGASTSPMDRQLSRQFDVGGLARASSFMPDSLQSASPMALSCGATSPMTVACAPTSPDTLERLPTSPIEYAGAMQVGAAAALTSAPNDESQTALVLQSQRSEPHRSGHRG